MTLQELYTKLKATGYPVAYLVFPVESLPAMPYIVYYTVTEEVSGADNKACESKKLMNVELYTETKDETAEALVEAQLTDFIWKKTEDYLINEKCFCLTYQFEVV